LKLGWDPQKKTYELQARNSTNSFVSFHFQKENFQNEKEIFIDFLATIDLKEKFFGSLIRINNQFVWDLNIPIINESIWKIDSTTKLFICSDDKGQNSAFCFINKLLIWQTSIHTHERFENFGGDLSCKNKKYLAFNCLVVSNLKQAQYTPKGSFSTSKNIKIKSFNLFFL